MDRAIRIYLFPGKETDIMKVILFTGIELIHADAEEPPDIATDSLKRC
jgi:hypothetical protein